MSKITGLTDYINKIVDSVNETLSDIEGNRDFSYDINQIQDETSTFCEELEKAIEDLKFEVWEVEKVQNFLNQFQNEIKSRISELDQVLDLVAGLDSQLQDISCDADIDCYPEEINIDEVYQMMIENRVEESTDLYENEDDDELPLEEEE